MIIYFVSRKGIKRQMVRVGDWVCFLHIVNKSNPCLKGNKSQQTFMSCTPDVLSFIK